MSGSLVDAERRAVLNRGAGWSGIHSANALVCSLSVIEIHALTL